MQEHIEALSAVTLGVCQEICFSGIPGHGGDLVGFLDSKGSMWEWWVTMGVIVP